MAEPVTLGRFFGALGKTWALIGALYLFDKYSPLGWWTFKPRPKVTWFSLLSPPPSPPSTAHPPALQPPLALPFPLPVLLFLQTFPPLNHSQEERAMAHIYERGPTPFPGDAAAGDPHAVDRYFERGGVATTVVPARFRQSSSAGSAGADVEGRRAAEEQRVKREALRLWLRMRREAERELKAQGYDPMQ
ncbi:unnamed protein product [Closterium sp. Naga37s-1]|nr:unnamed protein product [Closterium sp. Naga37s-1]